MQTTCLGCYNTIQSQLEVSMFILPLWIYTQVSSLVPAVGLGDPVKCRERSHSLVAFDTLGRHPRAHVCVNYRPPFQSCAFRTMKMDLRGETVRSVLNRNLAQLQPRSIGCLPRWNRRHSPAFATHWPFNRRLWRSFPCYRLDRH